VTKPSVILEGFLLDVNSPDAESLAITVDCTTLPGEKYLTLIRDLEDFLSDMDRGYSERKVRGRSLKGRYRRHLYGQEVLRTRRLSFIPYPSKVANLPGNLRRALYYEVNRQCLVLQREHTGRRRRVVYLLPFPKAPELMVYVDNLNRQIEDLNKELHRLKDTEVAKILAILEKYGVDGNLPVGSHLHGFSLNPRPVRLDPGIVEELVEKRYREQFERVKEEERRGYDLLRQELEYQRRTLISQAIDNLRGQIQAVASQVLAAGKKSPTRAKAELRRIKELAESAGLRALGESVINPLIEAIDNPEKTEALLGSRNLVEGVSLRIQGLVDSL